jgi:hypothetical protein
MFEPFAASSTIRRTRTLHWQDARLDAHRKGVTDPASCTSPGVQTRSALSVNVGESPAGRTKMSPNRDLSESATPVAMRRQGVLLHLFCDLDVSAAL